MFPSSNLPTPQPTEAPWAPWYSVVRQQALRSGRTPPAKTAVALLMTTRPRTTCTSKSRRNAAGLASARTAADTRSPRKRKVWGGLVVAGQDECIFQSEAATKKVWTMNGVSHLTPKTGVSLMVSGFTTGALGFGIELSEEQLAEVNEYRRQPTNNTYVCGVYNAPLSLCALGGMPLSDKKPDLKDSPGLRFIFN
jgi:hypothetical protein